MAAITDGVKALNAPCRPAVAHRPGAGLSAVERRRTFIAEAQHTESHGELEVIAKMVSGLINGLDRRVD